MNDVILGLQAIREQPEISKVLSQEDKKKWSSISWPSSEVIKKNRDKAKLKINLTIDVVQATQPLPPSIPALWIAQIKEGSPTRNPDEIHEEPLVPPPSELVIT